MGPKAKPSENRSMEDLQSEMNEKLSAMMEKIESLTATIRSVKKDNEDLKQTVLNQADFISHLQNELNEKELYSRSWSVRFLNFQIQTRICAEGEPGSQQQQEQPGQDCEDEAPLLRAPDQHHLQAAEVHPEPSGCPVSVDRERRHQIQAKKL
jgi:hypothetical protein